jgi:hypothetical protein
MAAYGLMDGFNAASDAAKKIVLPSHATYAAKKNLADKKALADAKVTAALAKQTAKDKAAAATAQAKTAAAELATAKGIAALKALGINGTITETDPIELEAARQNLIKQSLILRDQATQKQLEALNSQITLNGATQKYNDILSVIKDNKITSEEVSMLALKWGVSADVVRAYITQVTGIKAIDFKGFTTPGDVAATSWANALTMLNAYYAALSSKVAVAVPAAAAAMASPAAVPAVVSRALRSEETRVFSACMAALAASATALFPGRPCAP